MEALWNFLIILACMVMFVIYKKTKSYVGWKGLTHFLENNKDEWHVFDSFCRITISRFYRDRKLFGLLSEKIIPDIAAKIHSQNESRFSCWSAGCAYFGDKAGAASY